MTTRTPPPPIGTLVGQMLDQGYARAADATLRAVVAATSTPLIQQRLRELNEEAALLQTEGKKLTSDNPVLRALLADMEPGLKRAASAIDGGSGQIEASSGQLAGNVTQQLALAGMDPTTQAQISAVWNRPDPVAVAQLVDYADKPAWGTELTRYPGLTLDTLLNQAVMGMAQGWGPLRVARNITRMAGTLPLDQAQVLTRTLYMESYRSASALNEEVNKDILETSIRIGTLDDRVCMCCLALHGTELKVGEKVKDHHAGRCTKITIVKGRPRSIPTGEQWFNSLSEAQRLSIAGPGALEAINSGKAQIRDFVQSYTDPIFGDMVREASLKSLGVR